MANLTLAQLRAAQQANPPGEVNAPLVEAARQEILAVTGPNPEWESAPGRFPGLEPDAFTPINVGPPPAGADGNPPPNVSLPIQASTPVSSAPAGGGYTRIFPSEYASILDVPDAWKKIHWVGNGPWQHLEGWPAHPEFDSEVS